MQRVSAKSEKFRDNFFQENTKEKEAAIFPQEEKGGVFSGSECMCVATYNGHAHTLSHTHTRVAV